MQGGSSGIQNMRNESTTDSKIAHFPLHPKNLRILQVVNPRLHPPLLLQEDPNRQAQKLLGVV